MTFDDEILKELKKISKLITLSNGTAIEAELSRYATTDDRKKIWVLIDGIREADDIVKVSGLTQAPVYKFLKILEDSNLIERQHGKPPKRLLDYVPVRWIDLIQSDSKESNKEDQLPTSVQQPETQKEDENG